MKVVFIAGPYRDKPWRVQNNIHNARSMAETVWRFGGVALCPHMNSANFDGLVDDSQFLEGALELLRRSDAVYCRDTQTTSSGTQAELAIARELGMPILTCVDDVVEFLK